MRIGIAYRSKVKMEVEDGDVSWTNVPSLVQSSMPFAANSFNAELPLPYEALFGLSYQVTPKLLLMGEIGSVGWEDYRTLEIEMQGEAESFNSIATQNYDHTYNYSFGAEYAATEAIDLRLGYKYDASPSPDAYFNPQTPTTNYHAFTLGLGANLGGFNLDVMGEYLQGVERSFNNIENGLRGDLISTGWIFGLGLSYNLQ